MTQRSRPTRAPKTPARQATPQPGPTLIASKTTLHHGPLPSPDILREYELLHAGTAERIIQMAEYQARHRQAIEAKSLAADIEATQKQLEIQRLSVSGPIRNELVGTILGWSVAIACVGGAVYSAIHGFGALVVGAFLCLPVASIIKAIRSPFPPRKK